MSCVKEAEDFQTYGSGEGTTLQARFFFDFPKYITLPSYNQDLVRPLPPSIRVVKKLASSDFEERDEIFGHCDVTYHLEARISKGKDVVCGAHSEIIVVATTETPPPLDPEDLKNEYCLAAASSLGSFWKAKKKVVTVSVSSREPRPILFQSSKAECGLVETGLPLNFRARKMYKSGESLVVPPVMECEVTVTLEAITYFLEREEKRVLSIAEMGRSSNAIMKRRKFKTQKMQLKLDGWKRETDSVGGEVPLNGLLASQW